MAEPQTFSNRGRFLVLLATYLCLAMVVIFAGSRYFRTVQLYQPQASEFSFEGNDWVEWMDSDSGIIASHVHPILAYKPSLLREIVQPGDRLRKVDYKEVYNAESIEKITRSAPPGKVFAYQLQRENPVALSTEVLNLLVVNGFRLSFSFNRIGFYWQLMLWITGVGAFASVLILLILLPIIRENIRLNRPLLLVILASLLLFGNQFARYLYLIVENDLTETGIEKIFVFIHVGCVFAYSTTYLLFRMGSHSRLSTIPSVLAGLLLLAGVFHILFISNNLGLFHDLIESTTLLYFLIHVLGGVGLFFVGTSGSFTLRRHWDLRIIGIVSLLVFVHFLGTITPLPWANPYNEHVFFVISILLFFPLANVAFFPLRFGRVIVVLTQTIQYLIFFATSIFLFLVIDQLFEYTLGGNPYRMILEIITLILAVMLFRSIYLANEQRLSKYFVSSQQERTNRIRSFMAQIPQYTSPEQLLSDLQDKLNELFEPEELILWWKGSFGGENSPITLLVEPESVYQRLSLKNTVWSKNKQISAFLLPSDEEPGMLRSPFSLASPITVNEDNHGLLLLGRKKNGVYNISDLGLLSQVIQRTQLTLNVLLLITREKELLQENNMRRI